MYNKEEIKGFSFELFRQWIKERCNGLDTLTELNVSRDPNPHHALVEVYTELFEIEKREIFIEALLSVIADIIEYYKVNFNTSYFQSNPESTGDVYLSLERSLVVLSRIEAKEIPVRVKSILRKISDIFLIQSNNFNTGSLRRLYLTVRNLVKDKIDNSELIEAIRSKDTFVVAFQIASKQNYLFAIKNYFSSFLTTAIENNQKTLIKTEVFNLLTEYGVNSHEANIIVQEIRSSIIGVPEEILNLIEQACLPFGIQFSGTQPILKVIEARKKEANSKSVLVTVNDNYVGGDNYTNFISIVLDTLAKDTNSIVQSYPKETFRWDLTAALLAENQFDFCCDPYFKTIPRSYLVDVVPYGHLHKFTAIIPKEREIHNSSLFDTGITFEKRLLGFLSSFVSSTNLSPNQNTIVGVLGETPAAAEVLKIVGPLGIFRNRIYNGSSIINLRIWQSEFPKSRIIICDVGVARDIGELKYEDLTKEHFTINKENFNQGYESGISVKDLMFDYKNPIQSGLIYPISDGQWYDEIIKALKVSIKENFPEISWKKISQELVKIGVIPYSDDDFYFGLLSLNKDPEFIIKYYEELKRIEDYENLKILTQNEQILEIINKHEK